MAQTIKIKRSSTTTAPTSLASGELAYSTKTGVQKLYYGDGTDVLAIGGKSYTDKLDGIEALADVTDAINVEAAGALMDSEVTNLADVKAFDTSDYATAAQGTLATNALPKSGGTMTGAITTNSTFDGRDVATDGTKLDGIEAGADVTDATNVAAAGAVMTTGGSLSSHLSFGDNVKAQFGNQTNGDLQIYHDGNNSIIKDSGTGILRYTSANSTAQGVVLEVENTDSDNLSGSFIHFKDSLGITPAKIGALSNEMYLMRGSNNDRILVTNGSAVELYNADNKVFETTSLGINVVGTVEFDGLSGTGSVTVTDILDQDNMSSNSATALATQQSIKAYVDNATTMGNFTFTGDEIISSGSTMTLDPHADGITGKVVVNGDLEVKGTTTTIDSTQVTINDAYLQLNSGLGASATPVSSMICGFEVNRGAGETGSTHDAGLYWYEGSNEWKVSEGQTASHALIHANNFESVVTSLDGGTF